MPDLERLNRALVRARAAGEQHLPELERVYARVLRAAGRGAADSFTQQATVTAAVDPWLPPTGDLVNGEQFEQDAAERIKPAHRRLLKTVTPAADLGIDWSVKNPTSQALLAGVAARLGQLGDAIREQVNEAIQVGYENGSSVAATASAIVEKVDSVTPARAAMLARTDLNALANGGAVMMASAVDGVTAKTWLATEDERTRETHAEADGQTVPVDQPFTVGGEQAMYPGDPDLSDAEACNCRCTVVFGDDLTAAATPDFSGHGMVALYPRIEEAADLALVDGQPPESMHVTLLYLGTADMIDGSLVESVVDRVASTSAPLDGTVGGCGMFAEGADGVPVILLPDVKGLAALQQDVERALRVAGVESPSEHGFLPHMTLQYAADPGVPDAALVGSPLHFDHISVDVGDRRVDFPLNPTITAGGDMTSTLDEGLASGASGDAPTSSDTERLAALREIYPDLDGFGDRELLAIHALSARSRHDYRGDGGACVLCGMPADDQAAHYDSTTVELTEIVVTAAVDGGPSRWQATLLVEGDPTEDGRLLMPGSISWRKLPLTLGLMLETSHTDMALAPTCGRIDQIWRAGNAVQAAGVFTDDSEDPQLAETGRQAVAAVRDRVVRGISVDLAVIESDMVFQPDDEPDVDADDVMDVAGEDELPDVDDGMGVPVEIVEVPEIGEPEGRWLYAVTDGVIGSACIVPFAAIAEATIEVVTAAAAGFDSARVTWPLFGCGCDGLTAAAAPLRPPAQWFENPHLKGPTPLTVTADGHVYGHIALWASCHAGYPDRCVPPPRSRTGYAHFHVGELELADGNRVSVGKITLAAGHAGTTGVTAAQARAHYDNSATVAAFVRAGEDSFGTWVAGALRSDLTAELRRDLMANPPSGDWRNNEMIAVHAVPTPGFPVLRAAAYDDAGEEIETALIISSPLASLSDDAASGIDEPVGALVHFRPGRRKVA